MQQSIAILGRQPAIGLAELESLYGTSVYPVGPQKQAAVIDRPADEIDFRRLGGSIKLGSVEARISSGPAIQWDAIEKQLRKTVLDLAAKTPDGKLKLGISTYGLSVSIPKLGAVALTLKKALKGLDREGSVRVVPNKELELNSAQVLHNGLATPTGIELLLVRDGSTVIVGRTTAVQDIDAYAARDQGRPKRDARVGMLPPKLAQTIVNLATADTTPSDATAVLDPFCGTGVVLQEAALMGFDVYGTDIEQRMIDFTAKNLEWLNERHGRPDVEPHLEAGDATNAKWTPVPHIIAAETYLGQPFSTMPSGEKLAEVRNVCNTILRKFLTNISRQIAPGTRLCLAVPAWQIRPSQFQHLSALDHLEELGYNRVSFKHVSEADLVYARADQIVARELLVLKKN